MNGTCAGGTGAFIDQMASLLNTDTAGLNELAKNYKMIYPIASRCGVFAKTDIQPLINDGAKTSDIAASIFQAVVNQMISGLACGHPIKGKVAFLGGPLEYLSERGINGELISDNETINIQTPGQREYKSENFKYISVFSLAEASVVSYEGLKYPLDNYTITQSFPIGVSNEFISEICRIDLKSGKLLVIRTKSDK